MEIYICDYIITCLLPIYYQIIVLYGTVLPLF